MMRFNIKNAYVSYFELYPHLRYKAPHVNPAPKAVNIILSPFLSSCSNSSRHKGIEAALVLPYF